VALMCSRCAVRRII